MAKQVEFFFDVGSPTAYLAATQLPAIASATGAALVYRPMLLGGVFQATGNASPATVAAKGRFMNADLKRFAARYGVPFAHNPSFPINTLFLMRAATAVQRHDPARFAAYLDAVWRAMWVDPRDMNDPTVVAAVVGAAGFDVQALVAQAAEPDVKAALKATTEEAVARGVFGAPTMFVDDTLYFGQDRLDFVREALAA